MIFDIDPLADRRWPEFVQNHPSATPFHSAGWLRALSDTYGYRPAALTTHGPDEGLNTGLAYCDVESWATGHRLVSVPFADYCDPLANAPGDLVELLQAFEGKVSRAHCRYGEVRLRGNAPPSVPQLGVAQQYFYHAIDLRAGTDAVFATFHKDCIQRKIRRAERERVTVAVEDDVDVFFHLHLSTRRRHHLPPQPIDWFRNLMRHMRQATTIWVARHNGEPIAAILTLEHARRLYYKYGASDQRFHRLGAMPLLFWRLAEYGASIGADSIDLGRSDLDDAGLVAFKEHLGAIRSTLAYCRFPAPGSLEQHRDSISMRLVQRACAVAPDRCLAMLGAILYRHSA